MKKTTSIEVKCECIIPFHAELVVYLQNLLNGAVTESEFANEIPHRESICRAVQDKVLFIKISFARPVGQWRYRLLWAVRQILGKNVVGTIRNGRQLTIVML